MESKNGKMRKLFSNNEIWLLLVFNMFFCIMCSGLFSKAQNSEIEIYTYGYKNENAFNADVLLASIRVDGRELNLSSIPLSGDFQHDSVYDDIIIRPTNEGIEHILKIELDAYEDIVLTFGYNPESGLIGIRDGNNYTEIDLYASEYEAYSYTVKSNLRTESILDITFAYLKKSLGVFGFVLLIGTCIYIKKKRNITSKKLVLKFSSIMVQNYFLVLFSYLYKSLSFEQIILVSSILVWGIIPLEKKKIKEKLPFLLMCFFWLITLYITFSFAGSSIFLSLNKLEIDGVDVFTFLGLAFSAHFVLFKLMDLFSENAPKKIIIFTNFIIKIIIYNKKLIITAWFFITSVLVYYLTKDYFKSSSIVLFISLIMVIFMFCGNWCKKSDKIFIKYFLYSVFVMLPFMLVFNPANLTSDSFDQLSQIWGIYGYDDHHPIMHTLLQGFLLFLCNNVIIVTIFQICLFSFVNARCAYYLYKRGVNYNYTCFILLLSSLWPSTIIHVVTLWKDVLFSISILWMTVILAEMADDYKGYFSKVRNIVELMLAFLMLGTFRHNGMLILFCLLLVMCAVAIRIREYKMVLIVVCITLAVFSSRKIAINVLEVKPNGSLASVVLFHGLSYEKYMGIELPNEVNAYMEDILPEQSIKEAYYQYSANSYMYSDEAIANNALSKFKNTDLKKILQYYVEAFTRNPYLLIKDRLYGTDLLWNVVKENDSYNAMYVTWVDSNSLQIERTYTPYEKNIRDVLLRTEKYDYLFWRGGLHIDILLLILLMGFIQKRKWVGFILLPAIFNVGSLFLSMAWQEYRYVWFLWLVIPFVFSYVFLIPQKLKDKDVV